MQRTSSEKRTEAALVDYVSTVAENFSSMVDAVTTKSSSPSKSELEDAVREEVAKAIAPTNVAIAELKELLLASKKQ